MEKNSNYHTIKDSFFLDGLKLKKESSTPITTVNSVDSFLSEVKKANGDRIKGALYTRDQ